MTDTRSVKMGFLRLHQLPLKALCFDLAEQLNYTKKSQIAHSCGLNSIIQTCCPLALHSHSNRGGSSFYEICDKMEVRGPKRLSMCVAFKAIVAGGCRHDDCSSWSSSSEDTHVRAPSSSNTCRPTTFKHGYFDHDPFLINGVCSKAVTQLSVHLK